MATVIRLLHCCACRQLLSRNQVLCGHELLACCQVLARSKLVRRLQLQNGVCKRLSTMCKSGHKPSHIVNPCQKDKTLPCPCRPHPLEIPSFHECHIPSAHLCHLLTGHLLLLMLLLQLLRLSCGHPHLLAGSKRRRMLLLLLLLLVLLLCCQLSQHAGRWHQTVVRCGTWHAIWRAAEEGRCVGVLSSQGPAKQCWLVKVGTNMQLDT
jgi:hypothetical protein